MKKFLFSKIFLFFVTGAAIFFALSGFLGGKSNYLTLLFLPVVAFLILSLLETLKTGRPAVILEEKKSAFWIYLLLIGGLLVITGGKIKNQNLSYFSNSPSPTINFSPTPTPTIIPKKWVKITPETSTSKVNLREKPNLTSEVIYKAEAGEEFVFLKKLGDWYEIEYQGKPAYVNKNYSQIMEK